MKGKVLQLDQLIELRHAKIKIAVLKDLLFVAIAAIIILAASLGITARRSWQGGYEQAKKEIHKQAKIAEMTGKQGN